MEYLMLSLNENIYFLTHTGGHIMQKILIVEDDEKLRHELEIFLNRNGYEVA